MIFVFFFGLGMDFFIVGESVFGVNNVFSISVFSDEYFYLMVFFS